MENSVQKALDAKRKRTLRVRKKIRGSKECPRLCVIKSNRHIYAQLIDDVDGTTLASMSTCSKELQQGNDLKKSKETARLIGEKLAEKAKALGIGRAVFDRGPFKFHGILAELANAARATGLVI